MKNVLALMAVVVSITPLPAEAQERNDTVRINKTRVAEFLSADQGGLHLSTGFVPYGDITSLELKVGTRSRWPEGMLIGGATGAVGGLLAGVVGCGGEADDSGACAAVTAALIPIGAAAGGVVGALVGAGMRSDRFTPILLPISGVGMSGSAGARPGLTLGVQLRF